MPVDKSKFPIVLLCIVATFFSGCATGPKRMVSDWREYNESTVEVGNQELLLNLVRLRYDEYPGLLRVTNITAQRNWTYSGTLAANVPEGGPDALAAGLTGLRSERPTVSFNPGGRELIAAALKPVSLDVLYLAAYMGWPASITWPLMIKSINDVNIAPSHHGQMPGTAEMTNEFLMIALSVRSLQDQRLLEVGRIEKLVPINEGLDPQLITASDRIQALNSGYTFVDSSNGDSLTLSKTKQLTVLRFAAEAIGTPEHANLVQMLGIDPQSKTFELEPAYEGYLKEEDLPRQDIEIGMRSLFEMLFLLSRGVQVPQCDLRCGVAPALADYPISDSMVGGFVVKCCDKRPACASVAVQYRDTWFYIDSRDQDSKAKFFLLKLIFDTQTEAAIDDSAPLLTLPL